MFPGTNPERTQMAFAAQNPNSDYQPPLSVANPRLLISPPRAAISIDTSPTKRLTYPVTNRSHP